VTKRAGDAGSLLGLRSAKSIGMVGALSLVLLVSGALPIGKQRRSATDPTAKAKLAYRQLQEQLGGDPASADSGDVDRGYGAHPGQDASLPRDLFQPLWRAPAPGDMVRAPERPAGPPALTGIFIDGATREAVLGGERVREGDRVADYRVILIQPDGVSLQKGASTIELQWGVNR
jgi:hypothetical protein